MSSASRVEASAILLEPLASTFTALDGLVAVGAAAILCSVFFLVRQRQHAAAVTAPPAMQALVRRAQQRSLAWVTTLTAALVQSVGGMAAFALYIYPAGGFSHAVLFADAPWCRALCVFFFVSMVMDLLLGVLFYRPHVQLLTGWVHHVLYGALVIHLLRTNATVALVAVMVEELPTGIMALGQVEPRRRSDLAFGVAFAATRIIFHTWYALGLVTQSWATRHPAVKPAVVLSVLALVMHTHWFVQWYRNVGAYLSGNRQRQWVVAETNGAAAKED